VTDDPQNQRREERVDTDPASHLALRRDAGLSGAQAGGEALSYESSIPGALEPGERVLFECQPDPSPARQPLVPRVALVIFVSVMVAVSAAAVTSDPVVTGIAGLVAVILVGVAVVLGSDDRRARRELGHTTLRVTDRRVMRTDDRPGRETLEVSATGFDQVRVARDRRRGGSVTVGAATFTHVPDAGRFERAVIDLVIRSGRRRHIRRMPSHEQAASRMNAAVQQQQQQPELSLPDGLILAADEQVLWTGRPRVAESFDRAWLLRRLHLIAWLLIPLGFLLAALGVLEPWIDRAHFFYGFLGGFLLLAGLYSLLVAPFVQAFRRSRTSYALTNIRAIVHTRSLRRGSVTGSYLLDMAGMTELREHSDGAGDVWLSAGATFERIERPREVHLLVLEAVRNAGTPLMPPGEEVDMP